MALYLDSSAIVKLVVREAESAALRRLLRAHPVRVSSALARVEVTRAVRAQSPAVRARAQAVLTRIRLLRIDDDILSTASMLDPGVLRSLDAIHLASASALGAELDALVTYDARMRDAAAILGYPTLAPA